MGVFLSEDLSYICIAGLTEKLIDIFSKSPDMDSARIEKISSGLQERIREFKKFTSKKVRSIEKQGKKKDVSR